MKTKANDIPEYLKGMSAAQIVDKAIQKFILQKANSEEGIYEEMLEKEFDGWTQMILLLAVKDALCNCDKQMRIKELIDGIGDGPGDRAIAFLNMVLPKE